MTKYIVENGCSFPLCALIDDNYVNYLTGEVITNQSIISFIKNGLKWKSMKVVEMELIIYEISGMKWVRGSSGEHHGLVYTPVAYNYQINGCSNYLNDNKQPLSSSERQFVVNKLMLKEYKQEIIWGGKW